MTAFQSLIPLPIAALCAVGVPAASVNALEGDYRAPDA